MTAEEMIKKRNKAIKDIQVNLELLVKSVDGLLKLDKELYPVLRQPDSMFNDCPISGLRTMAYLRRNMAKLGWRWAIPLYDGTTEAKKFIDEMQDGSTWAERFSGTKEVFDKLK